MKDKPNSAVVTMEKGEKYGRMHLQILSLVWGILHNELTLLSIYDLLVIKLKCFSHTLLSAIL